MTDRIPRVSVVIASIVGEAFLDDCLTSLEPQARSMDAEVIVVACGPAERAERLRRQFPWTRIIHRPGRETVPQLRLHGVLHATGKIVAIIEEHCLPARDWLRTAVNAFASGDNQVVGGPVVDLGYARLRDWAVYFCEYNGYLPPWREGESHDLGSANIAYSRELLLKHQDRLADGYWEAGLHPVLLVEGVRFRSVADMVVHHCGPFNYGYYLQQRYWFSRAFAGCRSQHLSASRKLAYFAAAPLVPALLLARIAKRVVDRNCRIGKFIQALPLMIPAMMVYVAGEVVGYAAGPGDALLKVE